MTDSGITDFDLVLFGEGKHERIYDKLGAHAYGQGSAAGTRFAVWAPNAERVSVVRDLNHLYRATPQLHGSDCDHNGFRWVDLHNADESIWAFARLGVGQNDGAPITCVFNATPVPRDGYRVGVAGQGNYRKLFDSDDARFGGSSYNRQTEAGAAHEGAQGYPCSLRLNLPPLGAMFFIGPV